MTAESRHQRILRDLLAERGYPRGTYTLDLTTGEGTFLPCGTEDDPVEECSGVVVGRDGRRIFYWMAWDAAAGRPALVEWEEEP